MNSIKQIIIKFLEADGGWVFAGKIEDYIRSELGAKASNASRRCRELEKSGILEKSLVQIDGKGPRVVRYRIIREPRVLASGYIDNEMENWVINKGVDKSYGQDTLKM